MRIWSPRTIHQYLLALIFVVAVPLTVLSLVLGDIWFNRAIDREARSNLDFAKAVALTFNGYIHDILRSEAVLSAALFSGKYSKPEMNELLAHADDRYIAIVYINLVDPNGNTIASSIPSALGINISDRPYFKKILAGQDQIVSDLVISYISRSAILTVSEAFRDPDGTLKGVVVAVIDPDKLGERALKLDRPEGARFSLFDSTGAIVYTRPEVKFDVEPAKRRINDTLLEDAKKNPSGAYGIFNSPIDGRKVAGARVYMPEIGYYAGGSLDYDLIVQPIRRIIIMLAVITIGVIFASILIALKLAEGLTKRLQALQEHAFEIGSGSLNHQIAPTGIREIDQLSGSLNLMARQLETRQTQQELASNELARSNKELEQFAYIASHDLQEPLHVISGYIQLLDRRYKGRLDAQADTYISFAVDAASRMRDLINDLLSYSRVGTRAQPFTEFETGPLVEEAISNLQIMIKKNNARIKVDPMPRITGDRLQFLQLFQNLISNAIKFRGKDPPQVEISAKKQDTEWLFSVKDNGIGIEPQYKERIFLIFQRLHSQKDYSGTGIGLAVCKKVVDRHGGKIWVESEPGKGSTFFFTIPER
jgi:signal transduction histidine kinase